jgi:aminoglycoside N3'-acetyltransferase
LSFLEHLKSSLNQVVTPDDRPVVVSAAMWPLLKAMGRKDAEAVEEVLDLLINMYGERGLLMPCFAAGFDERGRCDLDTATGSTGVLSESMRRRTGVVRTLSAWFSYLALGPCSQEVVELLPVEAWGEGSVYAWMEARDVCFLMLGTHPTHCSYLHRLEWLARDVLTYRFNKSFNGVLVRNGVSREIQETLFVRQLQPVEAINDFTKLMPYLDAAGMRQATVEGVSIVAYEACALRDAVLPAMRADTDLVLRNSLNDI